MFNRQQLASFARVAADFAETQITTRQWFHRACESLTAMEYHAINAVLPVIQQAPIFDGSTVEAACISRHLDVYSDLQEWRTICSEFTPAA